MATRANENTRWEKGVKVAFLLILLAWEIFGAPKVARYCEEHRAECERMRW